MSDMPDLSNLIGMLNNKGVDINSLMQYLNNSSNNSSNNAPSLDEILYNKSSTNNSANSNSSSNNSSQMPDMETMVKIMKLMNSINSNTVSPSTNLLYSLKPFLRDSKKERVDQYVKFLKISSVLSEINKSGGDFNEPSD